MENNNCKIHTTKKFSHYCCNEKYLICENCLKSHEGHLLYTIREVEELKKTGVDLLKNVKNNNITNQINQKNSVNKTSSQKIDINALASALNKQETINNNQINNNINVKNQMNITTPNKLIVNVDKNISKNIDKDDKAVGDNSSNFKQQEIKDSSQKNETNISGLPKNTSFSNSFTNFHDKNENNNTNNNIFINQVNETKKNFNINKNINEIKTGNTESDKKTKERDYMISDNKNNFSKEIFIKNNPTSNEIPNKVNKLEKDKENNENKSNMEIGNNQSNKDLFQINSEIKNKDKNFIIDLPSKFNLKEEKLLSISDRINKLNTNKNTNVENKMVNQTTLKVENTNVENKIIDQTIFKVEKNMDEKLIKKSNIIENQISEMKENKNIKIMEAKVCEGKEDNKNEKLNANNSKIKEEKHINNKLEFNKETPYNLRLNIQDNPIKKIENIEFFERSEKKSIEESIKKEQIEKKEETKDLCNKENQIVDIDNNHILNNNNIMEKSTSKKNFESEPPEKMIVNNVKAEIELDLILGKKIVNIEQNEKDTQIKNQILISNEKKQNLDMEINKPNTVKNLIDTNKKVETNVIEDKNIKINNNQKTVNEETQKNKVNDLINNLKKDEKNIKNDQILLENDNCKSVEKNNSEKMNNNFNTSTINSNKENLKVVSCTNSTNNKETKDNMQKMKEMLAKRLSVNDKTENKIIEKPQANNFNNNQSKNINEAEIEEIKNSKKHIFRNSKIN